MNALYKISKIFKVSLFIIFIIFLSTNITKSQDKNSSEIKKILFKKEESSMQALLQLNKRNLKIEKRKMTNIITTNKIDKKIFSEVSLPKYPD